MPSFFCCSISILEFKLEVSLYLFFKEFLSLSATIILLVVFSFAFVVVLLVVTGTFDFVVLGIALVEGCEVNVLEDVVVGLFLSKATLESVPKFFVVVGLAAIGVVFVFTTLVCSCLGVVVFDYVLEFTGGFFSTFGVFKIEALEDYTLVYVGCFVVAVVVFGFVYIFVYVFLVTVAGFIDL